MGPVAVLVVRPTIVIDEVVAILELVPEIGVIEVYARIDDGDDDAVTGCRFPRLGQTHHLQCVLVPCKGVGVGRLSAGGEQHAKCDKRDETLHGEEPIRVR